ncbi:Crp/Fnr family transcriptional regulator [Tropicimonas isoalkanivorans]|uniref:Crp-like helix-turn-helix domain-containing protein n=1 Tax=Tropicimonas isoalkanivorans TaxID=441112 RepID=A0A1I1ECR2_9RHOB|nr:Crp/Fnr family transcriptional regulator [Tropicimonas isoalkanivorans]SFB82703.1 Crp-like helix-turn-helix domain-containing protein [Tropicimonas isoalkanivorans]
MGKVAKIHLPDECHRCTLRGAALCRAVAASGLSGVRPARRWRYRRDDVVGGDGESGWVFGVLRSGFLRKEKLRPDGRRTLIGLACPGDLVSWQPETRPSYTLEAATDAEICAFDRQTVARMTAHDSRFQLFQVQEAYESHERQLELIWRRGALTSRERIISFLVMATEFMPVEHCPDGSLIVTVELSRRDWADLSNTTVETISRTLGHLAEKGLVTTVAPGRYRIRDLPLLTRLAGVEAEPDRTGIPVNAGLPAPPQSAPDTRSR